MTNCRCVLLLLAVVFINGFASTTAQYDVGCHAAVKHLHSNPYAYYFALVRRTIPACTTGGFWRHYQCHSSGCYCAYVDTGNVFTVKIDYRRGYYFSLNEWAAICPVRIQEEESSCQNPSLVYPCDLNAEKYIFDRSAHGCKPVTNTCRGYQSLQACERDCAPLIYDECSFPKDAGRPCKDVRNREIRYRHNPHTGSCEPFLFNGCGGGNANNYPSTWNCQKSCVTQALIKIEIRVRSGARYNATVPEWLVNKYELTTNGTNEVIDEVFNEIKEHATSLRRFYDQGGVSGRSGRINIINPQRGPSQAKFERDVFPSDIICVLPAKTGPCRAYKPRWFFNRAESKCVKFIYGGCAANGNNFDYSMECTKYCEAAATPSPQEEISPPRDGAGNPDPRFFLIPNRIAPGVVIHMIPGATTTAPFESTTAPEEPKEASGE